MNKYFNNILLINCKPIRVQDTFARFTKASLSRIFIAANQSVSIFASQRFLIRTASLRPLVYRAIISWDFPLRFDWALLKPFDQSKNAKHTRLNQQCFPTVHSPFTRKDQNPYFTSLFVRAFMMHVSFKSGITRTSDCSSTEACTRRLRVYLLFTAPSLSSFE